MIPYKFNIPWTQTIGAYDCNPISAEQHKKCAKSQFPHRKKKLLRKRDLKKISIFHAISVTNVQNVEGASKNSRRCIITKEFTGKRF